MTDDYSAINRAHWDEVTPIHARSPFYDVAGFLAGQSSLRPLEVTELGDVSGRTLLHLQCHFGMDTLSWARRGAIVTGLDFSPEAIALAESLRAQTGLPARFVCADLYDAPRVLAGPFDIVFTSYGVLVWLPDLARWAQIIAQLLRPGGTFYIAEEHPIANVFEEDADGVLRATYPYLSPEPLISEDEGTYTDRNASVTQRRTVQWLHPLSEVVGSLLAAGLRIEFLHEFPYCMYRKFPSLRQGADRFWHWPAGQEMIPLLFSLRARKPA